MTTKATTPNMRKLCESVHMELELTDLLVGAWQPTQSELEHLLDHLTECIYCQTTLGTLISVQANREPSLATKHVDPHQSLCNGQAEGDMCKDNPDRVTKALLAGMAEVIHETDILNDISEYIETLEMEGADQAYRQFPELASHLEQCRACQLQIEDIRALLHEAEREGLIEPLQAC